MIQDDRQVQTNQARQRAMPDDSVLLGKADGQNHHRMWHSALVWWDDSERGYTSGAYGKGR